MGTVGDRRRGEEKREDTNQAAAKKELEGAKSGTNEESKNRWLKLLEQHREKGTTVMTNWVGWLHITNSTSVARCPLAVIFLGTEAIV